MNRRIQIGVNGVLGRSAGRSGSFEWEGYEVVWPKKLSCIEISTSKELIRPSLEN